MKKIATLMLVCANILQAEIIEIGEIELKDSNRFDYQLNEINKRANDRALNLSLNKADSIQSLGDTSSTAAMANHIRNNNIFGVIDLNSSAFFQGALIDSGYASFFDQASMDDLRIDGSEISTSTIIARAPTLPRSLNTNSLTLKNIKIYGYDLNIGQNTYLKFHDEFDRMRELFLKTNIFKNGTLTANNSEIRADSIKSENIKSYNSTFSSAFIRTSNLEANNSNFSHSIVAIDTSLSGENNTILDSVVIARDKEGMLDDALFSSQAVAKGLSTISDKMIFASFDGFKVWQNLRTPISSMEKQLSLMLENYYFANFAFNNDDLFIKSLNDAKFELDLSTKKAEILAKIYKDLKILNKDNTFNIENLNALLCTADEIARFSCDKKIVDESASGFLNEENYKNYINSASVIKFDYDNLSMLDMKTQFLYDRAIDRAKYFNVKNPLNFDELVALSNDRQNLAQNIRANKIFGVISFDNVDLTNLDGKIALIDYKDKNSKQLVGFFDKSSLDTIQIDGKNTRNDREKIELLHSLEAKNIKLDNIDITLNDQINIKAGENTYLTFADSFEPNYLLYFKSNIYKNGVLDITNSHIAGSALSQNSHIFTDKLNITNSKIDRLYVRANDVTLKNASFVDSIVAISGSVSSENISGELNTIQNSIVVAKDSQNLLKDDLFIGASIESGFTKYTPNLMFASLDGYKVWRNISDLASIAKRPLAMQINNMSDEKFFASLVFDGGQFLELNPLNLLTIKDDKKSLLTSGILKQNGILNDDLSLDLDKLYTQLCTAEEIASGTCKVSIDKNKGSSNIAPQTFVIKSKDDMHVLDTISNKALKKAKELSLKANFSENDLSADAAKNIRDDKIYGVIDLDAPVLIDLEQPYKLIDLKNISDEPIAKGFDKISDDTLTIQPSDGLILENKINAKNININSTDILLQNDLFAGENSYLKFHDAKDGDRELYLKSNIYKNGTINIDDSYILSHPAYEISSENMNIKNSLLEGVFIRTSNLSVDDSGFLNSIIAIDRGLTSETKNNEIANSMIIVRDKNNKLSDDFFVAPKEEIGITNYQAPLVFASVDGFKVWNNISDTSVFEGTKAHNLVQMQKDKFYGTMAFDRMGILMLDSNNIPSISTTSGKDFILWQIYQELGLFNAANLIDIDKLNALLCTAEEIANNTCGDSGSVADSDLDGATDSTVDGDLDSSADSTADGAASQNTPQITITQAKIERNEAAINTAHTALAQASFSYVNEINSMSKRLGEVRHLAGKKGVWLRAFNGKGSYKDYQDIKYSAFHFGYDAMSENDFMLGVMAGIQEQNLSKEISGNYKSFMAGLYASKIYENDAFVDFVAKFIHGKGDFTHAILGDSEDGKLHTKAQNSILASAQIGKRFSQNSFAIEPSAEVIFGYLPSNEITSDKVALTQKEAIKMLFKPEISALYDSNNLILKMGVGALIDLNKAKAEYELSDNFGTSDTRSADFSRTFVNFGANYLASKNMRFGIELESTLSGEYKSDYTANFNLRYSY